MQRWVQIKLCPVHPGVSVLGVSCLIATVLLTAKLTRHTFDCFEVTLSQLHKCVMTFSRLRSLIDSRFKQWTKIRGNATALLKQYNLFLMPLSGLFFFSILRELLIAHIKGDLLCFVDFYDLLTLL